MIQMVCLVKIQNITLRSFETKVGVRQGDMLACFMFNTDFEKMTRNGELDNIGTIFNKSVHVLAKADEVHLIIRPVRTTKEAFTTLEAEMGINANDKRLQS